MNAGDEEHSEGQEKEEYPWEEEYTWEEIVEANKPLYLSFWHDALRELLGWSEARVDEWAKRYQKGLNGENSEFYRDSPQLYIVNIVTPDRLKNRLVGLQYVEFERRMEAAIGEDLSNPEDVRARVNQVLADYGETLPERE